MKQERNKPIQKYRRLFNRVSKILHLDWAPLEVEHVPSDEFDSYVPAVVQLLLQGDTVQEIADYLDQIGKEEMDAHLSRETLMKAAEKLKDLNVDGIPSQNE